ncbi:uncharacterized protein MONOS_18586 [Monocercomonoides exilis]|uniref:uncharacterized protein n=1 Tax=Monocercomonoides exilis TaxID=2049356 RepID=UPI00355A8074|nr:hypothetical protein MONOS_18586 [Monocercomonoides exilis]
MIFEEDKKEKKNEELLIGLCECYHLLNDFKDKKELYSITVPCLLKAAFIKEESEETQKEAEISLMALCNVAYLMNLDKEIYLEEIKEIITYHQKHRNMSRLAYQLSWNFLINRFYADRSMESVVMNELHFLREAERELEELSHYVDWKKKENEKTAKEPTASEMIKKWHSNLFDFFSGSDIEEKDYGSLISFLVRLYRLANECRKDICSTGIGVFERMSGRADVNIEGLMKSGVVDLILKEVCQSTLEDSISYNCLKLFLNLSGRLNEKEDNETEETERKATKRKMFDKIEEEGYEDIVTSFSVVLPFFNKHFLIVISECFEDYFVNV